jgi:hypothetical protein
MRIPVQSIADFAYPQGIDPPKRSANRLRLRNAITAQP